MREDEENLRRVARPHKASDRLDVLVTVHLEPGQKPLVLIGLPVSRVELRVLVQHFLVLILVRHDFLQPFELVLDLGELLLELRIFTKQLVIRCYQDIWADWLIGRARKGVAIEHGSASSRGCFELFGT